MTVEQVHSENKCYNCQNTCIRGDPSLVRAVGNIYHKQCFKCNTCQISVIDQFFIMNDSSVILCEKDYFEISGFKCHQCNESITKNNYEVIGDYKYHRHCLYCPGCTIVKNVPYFIDEEQDKEEEEEEESFERYDYNGRPYCRYHYSLIKGTECIGCGQAVLHQYMELPNSNGKWHPECCMIMKYWHVELSDLQPILQSDYKSKQQLVFIQDDIEYIRCNIWKELSNYEDTTSKIISSIILLHQSSDYKQEYEACLLLTSQLNIIFTILDLVFKYFTHLSCDVPTQKLTDQFVLFMDSLCQTNIKDTQNLTKLATLLSQYTRDLVKLSLQQTIILKRQNNDLIDQVLRIYSTKSFKQTTSLPCLNHSLRLIDIALSRLAFVLDIKPQQGKRPDETMVYKPNIIRPTLFPIVQQKRLVNSTSNIHHLTQPTLDTSSSIKRSKSTTKKQPELMTKNTTSRMDSLRRALTTRSNKKEATMNNNNNHSPSRANSIFSSNRRDQKSYSLHNPTTPPLYISLPDVGAIHTTPPLSPPSVNQTIWTIPPFLPDLTSQQDSILRHITVLFLESHVGNDPVLFDDLLGLLENNKRPSAASLWGKLKTHILTPNETTTTQPLMHNNNEKKIGVSLSNTSNGSLNNFQKIPEVQNFELWKTHCPSVISCFSPHSYAPGFLKDCVLAMIEQDVNTEGVFRKSGNIRVLKEMCEQLDDAQLQREDWLDFFREQNIIQLATFVKKYLRELPEPLITSRLYKLFLLSNDRADSVPIIHYAICLLPKVNRDILLLVLALLNWVARHSSENKMGFENLARVIAPNILYSHKKQSSSSAADVSLCHGEICVVATMIEYYHTFIEVPNEFTELLQNPKMAVYLATNSIDLTCSKQFLKSFSQLLKVKKDITPSDSVLPPSPSTSTV